MLFKFVLRNIRKRPLLNLIKVTGLALGLCGIMFIVLFVKNELSYDSWHPNAHRIYRITFTDPAFLNNGHFARNLNSKQIPELAAHFPEIENYVRLAPLMGGAIMNNERYFSFTQGFVCDSTFFTLFETELVVGDKQSVLNAPASMVVTESFSQKVFGAENPVGKVLSIPSGQYYGERMDFTIKGVMKSFPPNSHFHPDFITTPVDGKINWWSWTYLLLSEKGEPDNIIANYPAFLANYKNKRIEEIETKVYLQKLTDIHLYSDKLREIETNGNITNVFVLSIAALILLFISMSNFASLEWGMSGFNQKMLSINQLLGSSKRIRLQFFLLDSFFILLAAVVIAQVLAIFVNNYIRTNYNINLLNENFKLRIFILLVFCVVGIFAGLYPAIKLSFKRLIPDIRPKQFSANRNIVSRGIIITQFAFAIVLIVSVLVISRQTRFALNTSMGTGSKNVICFENVHTDVQKKFGLFKSELLNYHSIASVSAMCEPPGGEANDMFLFELEGYQKPDVGQDVRIGVFPCDSAFPGLFNLELLAGRTFSDKNVDIEGSGEYIINETAMHFLNHAQPGDIVGKSFKLHSGQQGVKLPAGQIIGVVKDFHLSSIKKKVGPLVMFKMDQLWLLNFVVSYKPGMREAAITDISNVWTKIFPDYPFDFEYIDSMYQNVYKTELLQAKILSVFTLISLFICCMGLLGITLLLTHQRVKEIGIRKVNGAKIWEVMVMLNKDFVKWVAIAFVIATPIAWYAMDRWLQNFAYRTELNWWIFVLAGLLALGIALLTVSWQSWKAAARNPIEALKYE